MNPGAGNIMFELKTLESLFRKNIDSAMRAMETDEQVTRMHHWIVGFLYNHQDQEIYQKDVESEFRISRSTTSSMVSLMEKKGLLIRENVPGDARLKKLTLTEKAKQNHEMHLERFQQLDAYFDSAITPEERAEFLRILDKLRSAAALSLEQYGNNNDRR